MIPSFAIEAVLESEKCEQGKPLSVLALIRNTSKGPQQLTIKYCGYHTLFQTDSEIVKIASHSCFSDKNETLVLQPGEQIEKCLRLYFSGGPSNNLVKFKIGFTPESEEGAPPTQSHVIWTEKELSLEHTNACPTAPYVTSSRYDQ